MTVVKLSRRQRVSSLPGGQEVLQVAANPRVLRERREWTDELVPYRQLQR